MTKPSQFYLMENSEEEIRLEIKTEPDAVREQARWCGLKEGMRVMDAGCGPGITSSILLEMIQPGGELLGIDYSEKRIQYAKGRYSHLTALNFMTHDLRTPLPDLGKFDLIWVRFVLEYNLGESVDIVRNLMHCLKPDGLLCLLDLDHNCLSHYELPPLMENLLYQMMAQLERDYNFDSYAGRKLYAYLYDLGFREIESDLKAHHLIYGAVRDADVFNWTKKIEMAGRMMTSLFDPYPGGFEGFYSDFRRFFTDYRRFTYTPMILCKGRKPAVV